MRLVAVVSVTRPDFVDRVCANLADCDKIILIEDNDREGMAKTRNRAIELFQTGDVIRFVDDDDIPYNSRLLASKFIDCDILTFSYVVNNRCIPILEDPVDAAMFSISSWNWLISAEAVWKIRDKYGELFVTNQSRNIGIWTWLRIIDSNLRIRSEPNLYGYAWNRLYQQDSMTGSNRTRGLPDDLFHELKKRGAAKNSNTLAQLAGRLGGFRQSVGYNIYGLDIQNSR